MTKEIINNLEILRAAVEAQPENLFDLTFFRSEQPCGTLFCTVGLASTLPHFQALGFEMVRSGSRYIVKINGKRVYDSEELDSVFGTEAFSRLFEPSGTGDDDVTLGFDDGDDGDEDKWEDSYSQNMTDKTLALKRLDRQINIYKGEQA